MITHDLRWSLPRGNTPVPSRWQATMSAVILCVPITSSTSCHQAIFVDQATDLSLSSDAVLAEVDRLG